MQNDRENRRDNSELFVIEGGGVAAHDRTTLEPPLTPPAGRWRRSSIYRSDIEAPSARTLPNN